MTLDEGIFETERTLSVRSYQYISGIVTFCHRQRHWSASASTLAFSHLKKIGLTKIMLGNRSFNVLALATFVAVGVLVPDFGGTRKLQSVEVSP